MNFFLAKQEHTCFGCKGDIQRGDEVARIPIKSRQGGNIGLLFHIDCFRKWNDEKFVERLLNWRLSVTPRPKLGRKRIPTTDRKRRRQLLSLLAYHKKLGHTAMVKEIQWWIKELELPLDK